ncbi:chorismate mutase [Pseudacidovorax sp. RU35E]|uniref:chorismate mutase n=1 Tax=Pseudacidovorax sp. RU35E TaxID=1907403 RepID=UPI00095673BB|nr:chorismate mutase [Pseudacidovorax sp. RU35E]SIR71217.1 chorismate mutase [Pseudacidovorax sp. RU35E]
MSPAIAGYRIPGLLALAALLTACAAPSGEPPSCDVSRLVELGAKRLDISRQVALAKWDSGHPVADPPGDPREAQVIAAAAQEAAEHGVAPERANAFFADQIEASKLIQIGLIAQWHRSGGAPREPRADLRTALRPALDMLRPALIDALKSAEPYRGRADCKRCVADATAAYADAHRLPALFAVGLDRGLARVCGD